MHIKAFALFDLKIFFKMPLPAPVGSNATPGFDDVRQYRACLPLNRQQAAGSILLVSASKSSVFSSS